MCVGYMSRHVAAMLARNVINLRRYSELAIDLTSKLTHEVSVFDEVFYLLSC